MRRSVTVSWLAALLLSVPAYADHPDGNRLTYLDGNNPYYVHLDFPKLTTPQWVGEEGVEAVVVLAIDDMRQPRKYEAYLRPILQRLKQIDGRAGLSIMTNAVDPEDDQLQRWLDEGLSIEVHTYDHPCPLLKDGDFEKARKSYERCVDLLSRIPGSQPVAYRMPCCDSLNTVSPRFFSEIFNKTTAQRNFLSIDTSVFHVFTAADPVVGESAGFDPDGRAKFAKYVPYERSFVNTIENYPYPYVIGGLCWEFPCVAPSDWSAQHLHKPNNPKTIDDWLTAIDLTVKKQGVFNLVFHPHGWIRNDQIVELIDRAVKQHGQKVKFLSFREAQQRLNESLLAGQPLRAADGGDNGVRLIDVNNDGYQDVVIANEDVCQTRIWSPEERVWKHASPHHQTGFPLSLIRDDGSNTGVRFGVLSPDGFASLICRNDGKTTGGWRFNGKRWITDGRLLDGLEIDGQPVSTSRDGIDLGVRLRDLDQDGISEAIIGNSLQQAVFQYDLRNHRWQRAPFSLPDGTAIARATGGDAGLRFVDIDEDGFQDVIFSDEAHYSLDLFRGMQNGWSERVLSGRRGDEGALPMIVCGETDNGAWFHSRHMWVQNEQTADLPNLVDRRGYDELLKDVFPGPRTPQKSLEAMVPRSGFEVELVAAEPLVVDPVAFEWGADGKLWVVEMIDYPSGMDGQGQPGGRVRYLEDSDGDGKYDRSTLFLEGLNFPTGVMPWQKGVLVTAAPEIFYAEDTDGDGRADVRKTLYEGFHEGNQQHRVNGLTYGLDNWVHCANGDSGGRVTSAETGKQVSLRGRDLRIHPKSGDIDTLTGQSQFGRNRDSWGNWFGNSNSRPMFHFVLSDRYTRRNPHAAPPRSTVQISVNPGAAPCYPVSRTLPRFNDFSMANRFTSACGAMIYDDDLFGSEFVGNSFVSEPVHNLVHREIVESRGFTFSSHRADDEQNSEFLASRDNWFRPTMLKAGPDGALYVADMYRRVIEHPEWVPDDWEARLDVRAGADRGRIYRVYPRGKKLRPVPRLADRSSAELVVALDSPYRWQRDTAQRLLMERRALDVTEELINVAKSANLPAARLQALCTLDGLERLNADVLRQAFHDSHPSVRRHALRMSEPFLNGPKSLGPDAALLVKDPDPQVALQLAYTLGEWRDSRAGTALAELAELAVRHSSERYLLAAVISSIDAENLTDVLNQLATQHDNQAAVGRVMEPLLTLAAALGDEKSLVAMFAALAKSDAGEHAPWQYTAMAAVLDGLDGEGQTLAAVRKEAGSKLAAEMDRLNELFVRARKIAVDDDADMTLRRNAVRLLGRGLSGQADDLNVLKSQLSAQTPAAVQSAAVAGMARYASPQLPGMLLAEWRSHSPSLRGQIMDALLQNESWTASLLDHIESGEVAALDVDAARRQRLLESESEPIRSLAKQLFAGSINKDRQQVVERYQKQIADPGDPAAGKKVFAKVCANCHRLDGVGHEIGPDLAALTDRSTSALLVAIFDPNRAVEAKYVSYTAINDRGLSYSGMITSQTGNSLTLTAAEGKQHVVLRKNLDELVSSSKSLMPEGLEKDLTPDDVRNLTAYLQQSQPLRKRRWFPGNSPRLVTTSFDGTLSLQARRSEVRGDDLVYEKKYHNLGHWSNHNDFATWQVEVPHDGSYRVEIEWACPTDTAGNRFVVQAVQDRVTGVVAATGSWDEYQKIVVGVLKLTAGRQQITVRSEGAIKGYLFDLRSVTLSPQK